MSEMPRSARKSYQFCTVPRLPGPMGATWLGASVISLPAV